METKLDPTDLTCCICFELFDNPRILPCVHTFCEKCLDTYIQHQEKSTIKNGFPCPTCREFASVPDSSKNVSEWATQFKSNFFIKNLIESLGPASPLHAPASQHTVKCTKHGKELDLVCIDCDTLCCASCIAIAHRTCRQVCTLKETAEAKREMVRLLLEAADARLVRNGAFQVELAKHEKYFEDSKTHAFEALTINYHGVMALLQKAFDTAKENLAKDYTLILNKIAARTMSVSASRSLLQEVTKEADRLMRASDLSVVGQSAKVLSNLENLLAKHRRQDPSTVESVTKYAMSLQRGELKPIDFLPFLGQTKVIETECKVNLPQITQIPRRTSLPRQPSAPPENLLSTTPCSPPGNPYPHLSNPEQQRPSSFTWSEVQSSPATEQSSPASPYLGTSLLNPAVTVRLDKKVPVKVKEDKNKPEVRDITILPGNVIVLTDGGNNAVKSFYTQAPSLQYSRFMMDSKPHGVTHLIGHTIAVTVPRKKQVLLLNVTPNIFGKEKITTSQSYWAVVALTPEHLAVTTCPGSTPASIELIDLKGNVLQVIRRGVMCNPLHMICTPAKDIIVTDPTVKSGVISLRQNGDVVFKYQPPTAVAEIKRPMGVTVDKSGAVLVTDQGSNSMMLLTPEGQFVSQLIQVTSSGKLIGSAVGEKGYLVCAQENQLLEYRVTTDRS